jgi:hypothetical protein
MRSTLIALLLSTVAVASAEARSFPNAPLRTAGTLTCAVEPSMGFVVGSTRGMACRFVSNRGGFVQSYSGRMDRIGLDLGMTSGQTISWRVLTPSGASRSSMIDGIFAGPSAEATLVGGLGTQMHFDVQGERVVLEPVGHSGQAGFSFAIGEARMGIAADAPAIVR